MTSISAPNASPDLVILRGRLDTSRAGELKQLLEAHIASRGGDVELDLRELAFAGTAALQILLAARRALATEGRSLVVHGASPELHAWLGGPWVG